MASGSFQHPFALNEIDVLISLNYLPERYPSVTMPLQNC